MTTESINAARAASPTAIVAAIRSASQETGSDFDYLLSIAQRESNLDNTAKSKGSSAAGLFQFIDQTWLSLVKRYGKDHGLGHYADAISRTETGRLVVGSPETKSAILALREDPEISALMAGEAVAATKQSLECALGRSVCAGELYAAHFLGEGGARKLITLNEQQAHARADLAFPGASKANRNIFYHPDGRAKTIGEVHAWAVGDKATSPAPAQQLMTIAVSEAPRAPRNAPATSAPSRVARDEADSFGLTIRGQRLVFARDSAPPATTLPRAPLSLTAGVLEILSALAVPARASRQG
jgi:Transglycosylase SLT domain